MTSREADDAQTADVVARAMRIAASVPHVRGRPTLLAHWLFNYEDQLVHGDAVTFTSYALERVVVRVGEDALVLDCAPDPTRVGCTVHMPGLPDRVASVPRAGSVATAPVTWQPDPSSPPIPPQPPPP